MFILLGEPQAARIRAGQRWTISCALRLRGGRRGWQDIVAEWADLHGIDRDDAEAALIALGMTRPPG
jgi:hypothetical protein